MTKIDNAITAAIEKAEYDLLKKLGDQKTAEQPAAEAAE